MASEDEVRASLRWQGDYCRKAGSPVTGMVCEALASALDQSSETGRRALAWAGNRSQMVQDALPLRLAGAIHALHRAGRAPGLAPIYAATASPDAAARAIGEAIAAHDAELARWLDGPPQTNETGRAAVLMAGLLALAADWPDIAEFELLEIGSSAGLNLMLADFAYDLGGVTAGRAGSPVRLAPEWRGPPPPRTAPRIVDARGVDIQPVDLAAPGEADRLLAYIWPDQGERFDRAQRAVAMARANPPKLDRGDAADWLEAQLRMPQPAGRARVVMHSIVWPYLPEATRARIAGLIEDARKRAPPDRPIAWLAYEWPDGTAHAHQLALRDWAGPGRDRVLAKAQAHGSWIEWLAAPG